MTADAERSGRKGRSRGGRIREADEVSTRVRGALRGRLPGLDWIVSRYSPLLATQIGYRLGPLPQEGADADDILSDVWLVALPRLKDIAPRDGRFTPVLLAFLSTTAVHAVNHHLRRLAKRATREIPRSGPKSDPPTMSGLFGRTAAEITSVVARASRTEVQGKVLAALAKLGEQDRAVIVLRAIKGLSKGEAATELAEPPNSVAQRYRRAVKRLRGALPKSVVNDLAED